MKLLIYSLSLRNIMAYTIVKYRGDNCSGCGVMEHVRNETKANNTIEDLSFHNFKITEENMSIIEKEKIRSIPCFIISKDWEEKGRKTGVMTPVEFKEWIYSLTN